MNFIKSHYDYIEYTIKLAQEKMLEGFGGPFAAIVVKNDEILGIGHNKVTSSNDPTAHAEIVAIREACKKIKDYCLTGCVLYTNCEPCPMCLGAVYWARIDKIYYTSTRTDAKHAGFDDEFIYDEFSRSIETRKIPLIKIDHPDSKSPFTKWLSLKDKKLY